VILTPTGLDGAVVVDLERREDARGFFARTFDRATFAEAGLVPLVEQCNLSYNHRAGTLRGMHYQVAPALETKLVRCTAGAVLDVIVDVRRDSPTYLRSFSVELTADNRRALYVPAMFAHGYQTLTDGAEVSYQVSEAYTPGTERGLRHDDPALGLAWPLPVSVLSEKDAAWPLLGSGHA
jgi:dTDP-4-dehydrorhamnose 3,5-epimerase